MSFKKVLLSLFTINLLFSCTTPPSEEERVSTLPDSSGKIAEIVVVIDSVNWAGEIGDAIKDEFIKYFPGLPQAEPQFSMVVIPNSQFNSLLKSGRNILFVDITDEKKAGVFKKKNMWAKNQYTASIQAPTASEVRKLVLENGKELTEFFREGEIERIQSKVKKIAIGMPKTLQNEGVSVKVPKKYRLNVQKDDFHYYINDEPEYMQGILIHSMSMEEFTKDSLNIKDAIISVRDSITSKFIEGATEGSYMVTELLFLPKYKKLELEGKQVIETRGLWRMENEIMGGPFISYTVLDPENNRVVTVEAFVFAPSKKKRNFLLEHEAILKTVSLN